MYFLKLQSTTDRIYSNIAESIREKLEDIVK